MQTQEFYRYKDARGHVVIVDSLSAVPRAERATAERIKLDSEPAIEVPVPRATETPRAAPLPTATQLAELEDLGVHWPSFAVGFGSAVGLALLFFGLRKLSTPLGRFVLFVGGVLLLVAFYLGWLRRSTGQSDSPFASPSAVIQDARRAVEEMNQRNKKQDQEIDEILKQK